MLTFLSATIFYVGDTILLRLILLPHSQKVLVMNHSIFMLVCSISAE